MPFGSRPAADERGGVDGRGGRERSDGAGGGGESSLPEPTRLADSIADSARHPDQPPRRIASRSPGREGGGRPNKNIRAAGGRSAGPHRKPPLRVFTTTLWSYPSQHYGERVQGDKNYVGATPSWVIWQVLQRYTRAGDLVVDPMAGSGTTLDVARDLARKALGYDLAPSRDDIFRADARKLPLEDGKADLVFVDPPYSTHVEYSDDPACIGKLDAVVQPGDDPRTNAYFAAMEEAFIEAYRVLAPGAVLAVYVSDSFRKGKPFMPIGFELFAIMRDRGFAPVDIVAVSRGAEKLQRGNFHRAAEEGNFFLRGFNYLLLMQKPAERAEGGDEDAESAGRRAKGRLKANAAELERRFGAKAAPHSNRNRPPRPSKANKKELPGRDKGAGPGGERAQRREKGGGPLGPRATRNTKPGDRRSKPGGRL